MSAYRINPDRTKPWNDLPDLPIDESLYRTVPILEALGNAKEALGKLQGRSIAIPNQGLLINTISLQEAKASSEIENIFTTDDELYKAFSENQKEVTGPPKEVLKYREALWGGLEHLKRVGRFDIDYFVTVYQVVKQTNDGVRPPFAQVVIRRGNSGPSAGQVVYTPPRSTEIIRSKLENLCDFVNQDNGIAPLIKMAVGHYQFEVIHPFTDGNGRTGRIFNIHCLTHLGLIDYPILYLSKFIIENKADYYANLAGVSQRGDWGNWIIYMLRAVERTSLITYQKINDLVASRDAILDFIQSSTDIRRPEQLVGVLFEQPFIKVSHLTERGIYAENTARNYLNKLVEEEVLSLKVMQGHHYYLNKELYRILGD